MKSISLKADFNLRKWHTNSIELQKIIYEKEKQTKGIPISKENFVEKESKDCSLRDDCKVTENTDFAAGIEIKGEKILGIRWKENKDVLRIVRWIIMLCTA